MYEYDAVYEEMEEKKKAASFKVPKKDKKVQNVHMYNSWKDPKILSVI